MWFLLPFLHTAAAASQPWMAGVLGYSCLSSNRAGCCALGIRGQNPAVAPGVVLSPLPASPQPLQPCGAGRGGDSRGQTTIPPPDWLVTARLERWDMMPPGLRFPAAPPEAAHAPYGSRRLPAAPGAPPGAAPGCSVLLPAPPLVRLPVWLPVQFACRPGRLPVQLPAWLPVRQILGAPTERTAEPRG